MPTAKHLKVSLRQLFLGLQEEMSSHLATTRRGIPHPGTKGDASELRWLQFFQEYLPRRYCAEKAFVVDCAGRISEQQDVVIYDQQYSPFILNRAGAKYLPAESVYAVIEVKQDLTTGAIRYAGKKARSVRGLRRTSVPIPHAGGVYPAKVPGPILAGILSLSGPSGNGLSSNLETVLPSLPLSDRLDLGCALKSGSFTVDYGKSRRSHRLQVSDPDAALIFFFLALLEGLQSLATVPALDLEAYRKSL